MIIFLVLIILITLKNIFDQTSLKNIIDSIKSINISYILIASILISMYFVLQGIYMKSMLNIFNKKISLIKGIYYALIEFYFSGITPSSSGGQPVQLYYMTKDKIPIKCSYIILLLNTIYFKVILLTFGIIVLIFRNNYIINNEFIYIFFFILGFLADSFTIFFYSTLIFNQKLLKKILTIVCSIGSHFKRIKEIINSKNIDNILLEYSDELKLLKSNKKIIIYTFIVTFLQRLSMFSISYVIYRSLGFNTFNYFDLFAIQVSVQIAIEMLPLPGGAWLSENMLNNMFMLIFTGMAEVGMLLTRTFAFYIPLVISGLIILIYNIKIKFKKIA